MKPTDLAAEAAENEFNNRSQWPAMRGGDDYIKLTKAELSTIIQSAIEKATEELDRAFWALKDYRAAHASEG